MITSIYLIRHGEYKNPQRKFPGRLPGYPLSRTGIKQTQNLSAVFEKKSFAAIYASSLTRCLQTAQIIADKCKLQVKTDARLLEIKSPFDGIDQKQIQKLDGNFYQEKFIKAGGESLQQVFERMHDFIMEKVIQHQGQKVIAVTHGDLIMSVKSMYLDGRLPHHYSFNCDYVGLANGYILTFATGKFLHLAPIFESKFGILDN